MAAWREFRRPLRTQRDRVGAPRMTELGRAMWSGAFPLVWEVKCNLEFADPRYGEAKE